MADYDDRRVVGKPLTVAGGMTSTAEGIAELERKRAEIARSNRPPPTESFASVLGRGKRDPDEEEEPSEKEKRFAELPKKGPRPSLVHPSQRDAYGRDETSDEDVVIKG